MIKNKNGFTLVEIMIGILITSIMVIAAFQAFTALLVGKVRLIEETDIEQETFFFSQKLFEEIKKGGTLDYEEYFNRSVINLGAGNYLSGHFAKSSGFGNFGSGGSVGSYTFGDWFYYCRSGSGNIVGSGGCVTGNNNLSFIAGDNGGDFSGKQQRYGQYSFQFMDYNADYNTDDGDENNDGFINGDSDDEVLDDAPELFESGTGVTELYLISGDKKRRTFFRWNVVEDPNNKPVSANCDISNPKTPTGSGCLGTIQFLKLEGKDWGINHNKTGSGLYDGLVDTWLIDKSFTGGDDIVAGTGSMENYWLDLFDDSINVKQFEVFAYPNKDRNLAYNADNIEISPYIRLKITLTPSWKTKTKIKGKIPEFEFSTSINLTDIYSN